ncbi:uncharacterized protein LOC115875818 [Sitophilus oryzae]|uniref:Uncharacterized protein LOC115875818 n=1 Tax=Sitophilus oryzae TaxID=7048 RepID=A0A6J2X7I4_SITOR|nr:uncharacterized protein LOC115875818 [Sitophilus oryzae]
MLPGQTNSISGMESPMTPLPTAITTPPSGDAEKPRRKQIRRKIKSKLSETFPPYLQEAFFGKDLMDITDTKKIHSGSSDDEKDEKYHGMKLSTDEYMSVDVKSEKHSESSGHKSHEMLDLDKDEKSNATKDDDDDNTEDLKDVLALSGDLLDPDLVNSIINEEDDDLTKNTELETLGAATQYHKRCCSDNAIIHARNRISTDRDSREGREVLKLLYLPSTQLLAYLPNKGVVGASYLSFKFERLVSLAKYANISVLAKYTNSGNPP